MNFMIRSVAVVTMLAMPGITLAQSTTSPANRAPLSPTPQAGTTSTQPSRATYVTADQMARASKIIGATVYNDHNESVGSVNELLIGSNHDIESVVLSVGGFLGIKSKLVKVPASEIKVLPSRLVMSGASKDQLKQMPDYQMEPGKAS
jgi:sporulation protein YlmC with PRC-barrel domain